MPSTTAEDAVRVGEIAEDVLRRAGTRALLRIVEDGTVFPETVSVAILSQEPLVQPGEPAEAFLMEYTAIVSGHRAHRRRRPPRRRADPRERPARGHGAASRHHRGGRRSGRPTTAAAWSRPCNATGLVTPLFDPALTARDPDRHRPVPRQRRALRDQLGLEVEPLIRVYPGWLPAVRMPQREDRISIVFLGEEDLAAEIAGVVEGDEEGEEGEEGGGDDASGEGDGDE